MKEGDNMLDKVGGRKFIAFVFLETLASAAMFMRLMPVEQWVEFSEFAGTTYVLGNVVKAGVETITKKGK
jgi:hypothetical protein